MTQKKSKYLRCSRTQVFLYYNCPKCNAQYSFSGHELKHNKVNWICGCGESFTVPRIRSIDIRINRRKKLVKPNQVDSVIRVLVDMGYKKKQIKLLCLKYKKESKEDIIKKVILEINNEIDK